MGLRYLGNIIKPGYNPLASNITTGVNTAQYQGVFTLQQQAQAQNTQAWTADPLFENTTLLLQADNAANGAQNNTFLDSSSNNFTITRNGNTTQGSFTPFSQSPGWWSNYFGGDGNYLSTAYSADFSFSTGEFSIECWSYVQDAGRTADANKYGALISQGVVASTTNQWQFLIRIVSGVITEVLLEVNGAAAFSVTGQSISINAWHHFALCRSGTTLSIFVDGTRIGTTTYSTAINANTSGTLQIARNAYANTYQNWLSGYISNVRILNGTSAYSASSSTLTVPALPITDVTNTKLLTCQSSSFIDTNTQVAAKTITVNGTPSVQAFSPFAPQYQYTPTVTGGSGYFDGTGDFLTVPSTSALAMGTGDFCLEMWIYPTAPSGDQSIYANYAAGGVNTQMGIFIRSGNSIRFASWDTAFLDSAGGTIVANAWHHLVVCRSGNNSALFINGVRQATASGSPNNFSSTDSFSIGRRPANDQFFPGYIFGLRSVKGSSVYDPTQTTLTVPTAPLTAITNTSLLLNFTNAGITDGTLKNNLETVGNAQISTSVVKYGTGSMYFDGSGDYLVGNFATKDLYSFGTGDFTVEMWVYTSNLSNYQTLLDTRASDSQIAWCLFIDNTGKPYWYDASGVQLSSTALSSNTWTHLAVARSGSTLKMFLGGTQVFSGTNSNAQNPTGTFYVGRNAINAFLYTGYLDDLRITKGIARYTQNFTPPSVALPRQ